MIVQLSICLTLHFSEQVTVVRSFTTLVWSLLLDGRLNENKNCMEQRSITELLFMSYKKDSTVRD